MLVNAVERDGEYCIISVRTTFLNDGMEEKHGTITVNQRDYNEEMIESFDTKGYNPARKPGAGSKLSLHEPKVKVLVEDVKKRYQSITGVVIYLS